MLKIEKRLENIGQAIIDEFISHGLRQTTVTITQAGALSYLVVNVDTHPAAMFKKEEIAAMMREKYNANID